MGDKTGIEWTDATWNPVIGCSIVSPGCTNCYAMKVAARMERIGQAAYAGLGLTKPSKAGPVWTGRVVGNSVKAFEAPLRWKKPRRIFVNSMSDLFHESIDDSLIDKVFAVMALCPQHTFQVLTKRPERMNAYCNAAGINERIWRAADTIACDFYLTEHHPAAPYLMGGRDRAPWPLPQVWLGVSVEDQARADERIPLLLATPAAKRFLSCEPLLGPVDLTPKADRTYQLLSNWYGPNGFDETGSQPTRERMNGWFPRIDWLIVGGESGKDARPMRPDWARSLRDQCQAAGVPFFFKQWGAWHSDALAFTDMQGRCPPPNMKVGKKNAGRLLDGRTWDEVPV